MQSRTSLILYSVLGVAAAAAIVFGLNSIYGFLNSSPTSAASQRTATVARGTVQASVSASGNVGVANSASADFATSGTLSSVDVTVGKHVKAGQVLARIDPTTADNTLQSAQANLDQARSTLQTAESGLTAAQRASNAASLEQSQLAVTSDEQQLATDKTTLTEAKTQLASDRALDCPASVSSGESNTGATSNAESNSNAASSTTDSGATGTSGTGNSSSTATGATGTTGATSATQGTSGTTGTGSSGSSGVGSSSSGTRNTVAAITSSAADPGPTTGSTASTGSSTTTTSTTPTTSAATGVVSTVGPTTATFTGSVDPAGLATTYWFEYGTSATSLETSTAKYDAGAGSVAVPVSISVSGLKPNTTYLVELEGSNSSGTFNGGLQLFKTSGTTDSATTGAATDVGSTTASLGGSVSPDGLATTYWFEYGRSASQLGSRTASLNAGDGTAILTVTTSVSRLKGAATYYFRLVAKNASGTSTGAEASFTTSAAALPTVESGSASTVLTSAATLEGSVDPNGSPTTYWFEYGTTSALSHKTPVVSAGSGTTATEVTATVSGLKSNTEYLFRLVARNAFGTSSGISQVAKTAESACVTDAQTITTDEQAVSRQAATVTQAKESLDQTQATIISSETPSSATIEADEAAVAQDEATVSADQKALAETTLTSPIAGVVTAVDASVGQTVGGSGTTISNATESTSSSSSTGTGAETGGGTGSSSTSSGLITIDSLGQLEIVTGFPEADAVKIAVGQPATVTFPALPNVDVAGKVVAVASTSTVVSNVVTYNDTIALVNPPSDVKEGMTADVSVVDQTASDALYLPTSAITTTGTLSTVALLVNGKTTTTRVTTGLVGNSSTQIVSGLKQGDVVVEPTVSITSASAASTASTGSTGLTGLGGAGGFTGGGGGGFRGGG